MNNKLIVDRVNAHLDKYMIKAYAALARAWDRRGEKQRAEQARLTRNKYILSVMYAKEGK